MSRCRLMVLCLLVLAGVSGCMEGSKPDPLKRDSLYDRLGGTSGIRRIVDDFVANVAADASIKQRLRRHFREGDVDGLKQKLVDQIAQASGGPRLYKGKNMRDAHRGLKISDADFDALVSDLVKALDDNKVNPAAKKELLDLLGPLRSEVVEK
jgi:hemoglobin